MPHIATDETKLSFDTIKSKDSNLLHNSNMQNLVSAANAIDEEVEFLTAEIARLTAHKAVIVTFAGDDRNLQNTTAVKELCERGRSAEFKRTRW